MIPGCRKRDCILFSGRRLALLVVNHDEVNKSNNRVEYQNISQYNVTDSLQPNTFSTPKARLYNRSAYVTLRNYMPIWKVGP